MIRSLRDKRGFSLVEIIAVLSLVGLVSIFGGMFLVQMVKSYQWADDNAHLAQKAQVALTRIAVEMTYAQSGSLNIFEDKIEYVAEHPDNTPAINSIFRNGDKLIFSTNESEYTLTDRVTDTTLFEENSGNYFEVQLTLEGRNQAPQEFTKEIPIP